VSTDKLSETPGYPTHAQLLPATVLTDHGYRVQFARSKEELQAVQRLRFEVFNLEMGEGLDTSWASGLDVDRFDPVCHHLMVIHVATGAVVGTYRVQTSEMARDFLGFYSADEFTIDDLPRAVVDDAIEVGRACVSKPFRNRSVLFLLWRGLALYLIHNRKRYLFGCCSLTSQDAVEGKRVMEYLREQGHVHPEYSVQPQADWRCYGPELALDAAAAAQAVEIPKLFGIYLRYGAKVCGEPAIDRQFKTIDYLVLLDRTQLDEHSRSMFFARKGR
jgi:putative hemolysin